MSRRWRRSRSARGTRASFRRSRPRTRLRCLPAMARRSARRDPCCCVCRAGATRTSTLWERRSISMIDGAARLEQVFREAGRPLFIPYVMGGYPDVATSTRYAEALAKQADIIELGIPFSDPLADGPTIQAAGQTRL